MKKADLKGQRFGNFTVVEDAGSDKSGHALWKCICDCGTEKTVCATNLVRGLTTSCGCIQRKRASETKHYNDIAGEQFGMLTATKTTGFDSSGNAMWECRCECGNKTVVRYAHLKDGSVKSCGCFKNAPKKHGATQHGNILRIYRIWAGMKQRCNNPNRPKYPRYGGRGISVCQEWNDSFEAFSEWAMAHGYADNLTIDRIDNDGNYEPDNCRWITAEENNKHRWDDYRAERGCLNA